MRRASVHAECRVPGRVPEVWLTLMPSIPLGTTAMPLARMRGSQAPRTVHLAVVQFSCGLTGGLSSRDVRIRPPAPEPYGAASGGDTGRLCCKEQLANSNWQLACLLAIHMGCYPAIC